MSYGPTARRLYRKVHCEHFPRVNFHLGSKQGVAKTVFVWRPWDLPRF